MKIFLLILIVSFSGGCYYQYTVQQAKIDSLKVTENKLSSTIKALKASVADLEAEKSDVTKKIADAKAQVADLTNQAAAAAQAATAARQAADDAKKTADEAEGARAAADKDLQNVLNQPTTNKLGDIVSLNGKTYKDCFLTEVLPYGITVRTPEGYSTILYPFLPGALQQRFGYDREKSMELTQDQVDALNAIRISNKDN